MIEFERWNHPEPASWCQLPLFGC